MGKSENLWLLGGIFPPSAGFLTKIWGKGRQSTPGGGHKATSKEGAEGEYRSIIMGDNPAGHSFVLWNLVSRSFSNKL